MRGGASPFCTTAVLTAAVGVGLGLPAAVHARVEARRWEVTVAVHVEGETKKSVTVRLALPLPDAIREMTDLELVPRGLSPEVVGEGVAPHVTFAGAVNKPRRIAVSYVVETTRQSAPFPQILPVADPTPETVPYLAPARLFQSRSILVRDFLETHVGPKVRTGGANLFQAILEATRQELSWRGDGRSLALDVIRRRQGKRIGIERAFVTFLRCARIPARFVEGVNLASATKRKRVFWTEVWADGAWWPVSASRGWIGELPRSYVALARDGDRVVAVDGPATASYVVTAHPMRDGTGGGT
jgi:hypothetical protein